MFHREVFNATQEELQLDRYFPIASGDDYVLSEEEVGAEAEAEAEAVRRILVSEIHELEAAGGAGLKFPVQRIHDGREYTLLFRAIALGMLRHGVSSNNVSCRGG